MGEKVYLMEESGECSTYTFFYILINRFFEADFRKRLLRERRR